MNQNEKFAQELIGMEGDGQSFRVNDEAANDLTNVEIAEKFNDHVKRINDKFEEHNQAIQNFAGKIAEDLSGLEILPMGAYVLAKPFDKNPFQQIKVENGIITDLGGMTPEYKSNETGELEEETQAIRVAEVVEVGYKCEFVKPGDIIFYTIMSEAMIPFFKLGLVTVAENRIMAVVNEKLTERRRNYGK